MGLDGLALVGIEGIEGVHPEELAGVGVTQLSAHDTLTPASTMETRILRNPDLILLFTVPSGSSRRTATWR